MTGSKEKAIVLGDGGWGTAIAMVLAESGVEVALWSAFPEYAAEMTATRTNPRFLPGVSIPEKVEIISDPESLARGTVFFSVIPTKFLRTTLERIKPALPEGRLIVSATKGIEGQTLLMASQVISQVLTDHPVAVLSGPSHAEEVALRMPTTVVLASDPVDYAQQVQALLHTDRFRVYTHDDLIGVEMGGALKNVISIAAGIVDGLGYGSNTKSALLTRGLVEMARLGIRLGADRNSFFGLSGIGDLATSCFSPFGRNRSVGERLGKGASLDEILKEMDMVAEGVNTAQSIQALMDKYQVEMPICREVFAVIHEGKDPGLALQDLMTRKLKNEGEW